MKKLRDELSPNEQDMFKALGWEHMFDQDIAVMPFYTLAINRAFIENKQDRATESLRRAATHLWYGKYRGNEEFERLIQM